MFIYPSSFYTATNTRIFNSVLASTDGLEDLKSISSLAKMLLMLQKKGFFLIIYAVTSKPPAGSQCSWIKLNNSRCKTTIKQEYIKLVWHCVRLTRLCWDELRRESNYHWWICWKWRAFVEPARYSQALIMLLSAEDLGTGIKHSWWCDSIILQP